MLSKRTTSVLRGILGHSFKSVGFTRHPEPQFPKTHVLHGIPSQRFKKHVFYVASHVNVSTRTYFAWYPKPAFQKANVLRGILSQGFKKHAFYTASNATVSKSDCFTRFPTPEFENASVLRGVQSQRLIKQMFYVGSGISSQSVERRCVFIHSILSQCFKKHVFVLQSILNQPTHTMHALLCGILSHGFNKLMFYTVS